MIDRNNLALLPASAVILLSLGLTPQAAGIDATDTNQ